MLQAVEKIKACVSCIAERAEGERIDVGCAHF
jgi:hypothetical protein